MSYEDSDCDGQADETITCVTDSANCGRDDEYVDSYYSEFIQWESIVEMQDMLREADSEELELKLVAQEDRRQDRAREERGMKFRKAGHTKPRSATKRTANQPYRFRKDVRQRLGDKCWLPTDEQVLSDLDQQKREEQQYWAEFYADFDTIEADYESPFAQALEKEEARELDLLSFHIGDARTDRIIDQASQRRLDWWHRYRSLLELMVEASMESPYDEYNNGLFDACMEQGVFFRRVVSWVYGTRTMSNKELASVTGCEIFLLHQRYPEAFTPPVPVDYRKLWASEIATYAAKQAEVLVHERLQNDLEQVRAKRRFGAKAAGSKLRHLRTAPSRHDGTDLSL